MRPAKPGRPALLGSRLRFREFLKNPGGKVSEIRERGGASRQPGKEQETSRPNRTREHLRRYRDWLWPYRKELAGLLALGLVAEVLQQFVPLVTGAILDRVLASSGQRMGMVVWMGLAALILIVWSEILRSFRSLASMQLNAKAVLGLRRRVHAHMLRLPLRELSEFKTGGIVSRLTSDVDNVGGLLQSAVISPGMAAARVLIVTVILFSVSWRMALVALAVIPPIFLVSLLWVRKLRPIHRAIGEDRSQSSGRVAETFGGIRVVRGFGRDRREERRYALDQHAIVRKDQHAFGLGLVVWGIWEAAPAAAGLGLVCFGVYLVGHNLATVGDIFAFQMYTGLLLYPIWQIVTSMSETQRSMAALDRVFEVLEKPADLPDRPNAVEVPASVRELRFEHVAFGYREDKPVLKDVSLIVPGGSVVALVGPSGAGKSTLAELVARFHDPVSGVVKLNGRALADYRLAGYRRLLGIVSQEVFLFDGTVAENIAYGRLDATREEIEAAAGRAHAAEFIEKMPEGFDTVIGERGVKLSGGQRQRLSIARALLADPQILILDEATSNLDTESERLIQASLGRLISGRTTFVIAHRLSTIRNADMIVVLDEGRIVETGRHEDLMERRGRYWRLVANQMGTAAAGEYAPDAIEAEAVGAAG